MNKKKRNKFSIADKKEAVLKVLEEGLSYKTVANLLSTSHRLVSLWVASYKLHGNLGLSQRNNIHYSGDFKYSIIKDIEDNHLSLYQTSAKYNINPSVISKWKRGYEEFGISYLYTRKTRGRPPKMKEKKPIPRKKKVSLDPQHDLLAENLRLRIENAYLKKLHALTQKANEQKPSKS